MVAELTNERIDTAAITRCLATHSAGHEAWHDGTGYALHELAGMNVATQEALVRQLSVRDWREIELLAAIDLACARQAQRSAFDAAGVGRNAIGLALLRWNMDLLSEAERTQLVCAAIAKAHGGNGLDAALEAAQTWHPAPVIDALWKALDSADHVVVVHVAAILFYLHGLAAEPFDLALHPKFLCFVSDDEALRRAACADLRACIAKASKP